MSRLFRQEVVDAKRGEWLGRIRVATPISHSLLAICALAVGAALVAFAILGHYTRRERASGTLVPVAGLIEVTSPAQAEITQILVQQGTSVRAGDSLIAISSERASASMGATASLISEQLKLQRARLAADLVDLEKLLRQQTAALDTRIGMSRSQIAQLDAQLAIQRQQAQNARAMLDKIQPLLAKGYISVLQMQQQESAALEAEAQMKALARLRIDIEQQLQTQQDQLKQLPLTTAAQYHDMERKRAEIDQALAQNEAQRETLLRAPQDGVISSIWVSPGQSVSTGQTMLALVPQGSRLQARLLVPTRAIGFVMPYDKVVLRYQAYPYQKFGLHGGHVTNVSRSPMTVTQISSALGLQVAEAMYRVDVQLDSQAIEAYGKQEALKPGMALDADILLDRRRLIEWAFEPLYGMRRQASL